MCRAPAQSPNNFSQAVLFRRFHIRPPLAEVIFGLDTDRFWTILPTDGVWKGLPHDTADDRTFNQKLFFGRAGYVACWEPQPMLKVTGRRLDFPAPLLLTDDKAHGSWVDPDRPFMVTGINLPSPGCWEVTGTYKDDSLTFVVWVAN
jgi:hypothetical protein